LPIVLAIRTPATRPLTAITEAACRTLGAWLAPALRRPCAEDPAAPEDHVEQPTPPTPQPPEAASAPLAAALDDGSVDGNLMWIAQAARQLRKSHRFPPAARFGQRGVTFPAGAA
jgi:hypothetical protein